MKARTKSNFSKC